MPEMLHDPVYASDLVAQVAAVTPPAQRGDLMCMIAASAIAEAVKALGKDEVLGRVSRLLVQIHEA